MHNIVNKSHLLLTLNNSLVYRTKKFNHLAYKTIFIEDHYINDLRQKLAFINIFLKKNIFSIKIK